MHLYNLLYIPSPRHNIHPLHHVDSYVFALTHGCVIIRDASPAETHSFVKDAALQCTRVSVIRFSMGHLLTLLEIRLLAIPQGVLLKLASRWTTLTNSGFLTGSSVTRSYGLTGSRHQSKSDTVRPDPPRAYQN